MHQERYFEGEDFGSASRVQWAQNVAYQRNSGVGRAPSVGEPTVKKDNPTRFLDLSSGFRNRKNDGRDSNGPCNFVVPVNVPEKPLTEAVDPVLDAFPFDCNFTAAASTTSNIRLNLQGPDVDNFYRNRWLEVGGVFRKIVAYGGSTRVAVVDPPFDVAPPMGTIYTVRHDRPQGATTVLAAAGSTVQFQSGLLNAGSDLTQYALFFPGHSAPTSYRLFKVASYDVTTSTATLGISMALGSPSAAVDAGERVELMVISRDNVQPVIIVGSPDVQTSLSQGSGAGVGSTAHQMPKYKIKLCDMVLPNLDVGNGYGGRLSDYSHVYVSLSNDQGSSFSNVLYSNNQRANKALFKVPMSQFSDTTMFLFFDGGNIEQVVQLQPDQTLRVTVTLPDGDVLLFDNDHPSFFFPGFNFPIRSNPFEQTTFTFAITRV